MPARCCRSDFSDCMFRFFHGKKGKSGGCIRKFPACREPVRFRTPLPFLFTAGETFFLDFPFASTALHCRAGCRVQDQSAKVMLLEST